MPTIFRDIRERKEYFYWYWHYNGFELSFNWCFSIMPDRKWISNKNGWILTKLGRCGKDSSHIHPYIISFEADQQGETHDRCSDGWERLRCWARSCVGVCVEKNVLVTVRTLVLISAVMYMRPLLSVWSVPHRLGTLATQRLWMFIIQSGGRDREKRRVHSHFVFYIIQRQLNRSTYVHISCPGVWGRRAENHSGRRRLGWSRCES